MGLGAFTIRVIAEAIDSCNPMKSTVFIFANWHDRQWKRFVGATVKVWDLAYNLSGMWHEVIIFLPRYNFRKRDVPFTVVEIPLMDFPFIRNITFNMAMLLYILPAIWRWRPDIFYVRRGISLLPLIYSKLTRSFLVFEVNDDPYRKNINPGSRIVKKIRHIISVKSDELYLILCDLGVVITNRIKNKICSRNSHVDRDRLIVVPSGANTCLFKPLDRHECMASAGLQSSKKYICFTGSLLKYQGINILIEAAPHILKKVPECVFLVIGEGPMKDAWLREVKTSGLESEFCFTGQIDYYDLPVYIGAAEVCVAPFLKSVGMSSPVKIFDYMACGKPVVASKITGTTDVFERTGAVEIVPAEDPLELAAAVAKIINDKELAGKMGEKGREFILSIYDRSTLTRKINDEITARLANQNIS